MPHKIYLASSWKNSSQAYYLKMLRALGHQVYDFKSALPMPAGGPVSRSFNWATIDSKWESWTVSQYRFILLHHPHAAQGYLGDLRGMEWADTCVLLLPAGRNAHLEAGYMKGRGKRLIIHSTVEEERNFTPDLMYLLADNITISDEELTDALL